MPDEQGKPPLAEPCCDQFVELARNFRWFHFDVWQDILAMPYMTDPAKEYGVGGGAARREIRVNHCPSCGARVRANFYSRDLIFPNGFEREQIAPPPDLQETKELVDKVCDEKL